MRKQTNPMKNKAKTKKLRWSVRTDRRKNLPGKLPTGCYSSK